MQKTAIYHEVSVSEMNYLRSQGLNNEQIAERIGCSRATVGKYLPSQRKARAKLSDKDKKDIIELYKDGNTVNEIAETYDCNIQTVYNILKANGVNKACGKKMKPEPEEKLDPELKTEEPEMPDISSKQPGRGDMTVYQMGMYVGWKGTYHVNFTAHTVQLPDIGPLMRKEDLGFYIRDLMAIWKEM